MKRLVALRPANSIEGINGQRKASRLIRDGYVLGIRCAMGFFHDAVFHPCHCVRDMACDCDTATKRSIYEMGSSMNGDRVCDNALGIHLDFEVDVDRRTKEQF